MEPTASLEAQRKIRVDKAGIWAQGEKYINPTEWRRLQKEAGPR
jgi:endonuclease YncB( thermonuclease family)